MSYPLIEAQPPLKFIPPKLNFIVLRVTQLVLPVIARRRTKITQIQVENLSTLVQLYQQFQQGKIRFLMAFRHPTVQDPYPLLYLLSRLVPQAAKQENIPLSKPIHSHFLYDRGIPLWAGRWTAWLLPRLGGTPIHRGKFDRAGLRSIRELFANGKFPLSAAPEGATNGHNEIISPLEPGIAQMGFWCIEDLQKAGRSEEVFILPLGLQYRYLSPPWRAIEDLLSQLEADVGVQPSSQGKDSLYERLYNLGEHLLSLMEDFYKRFYHQSLGNKIDFSQRLQTLLDTALRVAEQYFDLLPKGTVIDRCRRLEQAGWDYIYREDLADLESVSTVERGLANRIAEEANLRLWHMRIVENFVAVTGKYVREKPTAERYADTLVQMWDMIAKMKGTNPSKPPKLGQKVAQITVGEPISVSSRWESYKASRRSAKQAVMDLTQDLQIALEGMIR
jgi:hypothetical protein